MDWIVILLIFAGIALLIHLSTIDLKIRLLPNVYVAAFALCGVMLHFVAPQFLTFQDMAFGALCGYGFLYALRFVANAYYKQDSLGLGDVKLLGAAGLWLGLNGVLLALTLGAFAGLLHGVGVALYLSVKNKQKPNLSRLAIPAGPGFAVGIVLAAVPIYGDFVIEALASLL